jgi:hypothetical protein
VGRPKSNVKKETATRQLIESDVRGGPKKGSTRVRLFKALENAGPTAGLSAAEIKKVTGMAENSGHLSMVLVEEVERGRLKVWTDHRGANAQEVKVYCLSALGKRDLAAGKVDRSSYAGRRIGKSYPSKDEK